MLEEDRWVCLNGECVREADARVPVTDRGFLFGDGIFTTIRINEGRIEFLSAHLARLYQQCRQLNMEPPLIPFEWIGELIRKNQALQGTWRLKIVVTGGNDSALRLPRRQAGLVLLTIKPYRFEVFSPVRLCLFPYPVVRPLAACKSLAYLDRLVIQEYACRQGYADAIVCDCKNHLLETAFSNLFWLSDETLFFPDPALPYLQGILLNQFLPYLKANIQFLKARLEDIPSDAVVYLCNALTHIRPVIAIGERSFGRLSQTENRLQQAIFEALQQEVV
ncbi:aminotransferase class IV [Candidatus Protochlamydia phocaeensis]|uniref:aminotransferase class IV n=1 Tax=Candidatus Protochlamydia phocaeensis TaxID=1414722 RepID=UPI00083849C8|nr:aminotransferase class IV [Candidatus Protochlamydia phocaeensis]